MDANIVAAPGQRVKPGRKSAAGRDATNPLVLLSHPEPTVRVKAEGITCSQAGFGSLPEAQAHAVALTGIGCTNVLLQSKRLRANVRWSVTFTPPAALAEYLRSIEQTQRARTAARSGADYTFSLANSHGVRYCWRTLDCSDEPYLTSAAGCSCPDWQRRGRYVNIACKHMIELRKRAAEGGLP